MNFSKQKKATLVLLMISLAVSLFYTSNADAEQARESIGESKFGNPSLFNKEDIYLGIAYVNGEGGKGGGGWALNAHYFIYDDVSAQLNTYRYIKGDTTINYVCTAAVYHHKLWKDFGFYGGPGLSYGKETKGNTTGMGESTTSVEGVYVTAGFELKYSKRVSVNFEVGIGLGLAVNYKL